MSERKGLSHIDWIALALFGVGIFGAVLLVAAAKSTEPLESLGGTARVAAMWAAVLGIAPGFAWHAGLVVLGTRLFLNGNPDRLARNLLGWTGLSVALAILLGAFGDKLGGAIGAHTGVVLREMVHVAVAVFVGAVAMFAVAWFAWLRNANELAPIAEQTSPTVMRAPRATTAVTAAETAALLPSRAELAQAARNDEDSDLGAGRKLATVSTAGGAAHPYPEDVRLKGQVPPGAKPLSAGSAVGAGASTILAAAAAETAPTVQRWSPARPLATPLVETMPAPLESSAPAAAWELEADEVELALAEDEAVAARATAMTDVRGALEQHDDDMDEDLEGLVGGAVEKGDGEDADGEEAVAVGGTTIASADLDLDEDLEEPEEVDELDELDRADATEVVGMLEVEPVEDVAPAPTTAREPTPPAASWEQADLFAGDNEPVDAYGTPLTLVESLRGNETVTPASSVASEPTQAEPDAVSVQRAALLEEMRAAQAVSPASSPSKVDDVAEADEALNAPEADVPPTRVTLVAAELGFERIELADSNVLEREVVPDFEDTRVELEPEFLIDDEVEPADEADEALEASEEVSQVEISELVVSEVEPTPIRVLETVATGPKVTPSLFDEAEAAAAVALTSVALTSVAAPAKKRSSHKPKAPVEAASEPEPDHVLEPHAVAPERTIKTLVLDDGRRKLLSEAGCLFVERGRVAVSMLQRQYAIDFDDACRVLDELQDLGLIGPYLGGQRRDILLTREQWLEKVSSP